MQTGSSRLLLCAHAVGQMPATPAAVWLSYAISLMSQTALHLCGMEHTAKESIVTLLIHHGPSRGSCLARRPSSIYYSASQTFLLIPGFLFPEVCPLPTCPHLSSLTVPLQTKNLSLTPFLVPNFKTPSVMRVVCSSCQGEKSLTGWSWILHCTFCGSGLRFDSRRVSLGLA